MSIENIFGIGTSGLTANRLALEVTSENVANVNTPGYSRQRAIFETNPTNILPTGSFGNGAKIAAIQRSYDQLLQQQLIGGNSTDGKNQAVLSSLQSVEPSFNELATSGLGQAMKDFFGAWQDLTVNPSGIPERQAVLTRAQILVDNFHQVSSTLNNAIQTADRTLPGITADITDKAKNIAMLNDQIRQTNLAGGNANELMDKRDLLVRDLASKVGINVSTDSSTPDYINITLAGGGQNLVQGKSYATVYTTPAGSPSTPSLNDIYITAMGTPPPAANSSIDTNVTNTIGGPNNSLGEIGGTLAVRGTTTNKGIIQGYQDTLDELAHTIATQVNASHTTGFNLNGNTGLNFFGTATSPGPPGAATGYSGTIELSSDLYTAGTLDPTKIAAASTAAGVPGDNTNAVTIADIAKSSTIPFSSGASSIDGFYNSFVSKVGIDVQSASNVADQSTAFLKQLNTLWQSNSGVSLDEELTNLIKYQRSFQGSAKLITTATDMMDTVLGLVR